MENYLLKFTVKWKWLSVLVLLMLGMTGAFSLVVNRIVDQFIPAYVRVMSDRFGLSVSFQRARYVFPEKIILEDVRISDKCAPTQPFFEIPRVSLLFSFPLLVSQGKIHLSQMVLSRIKIRAPALGRYLMGHAEGGFSGFDAPSYGPTRINLSEAQLYLFQDNRVAAPIVFNLDLSMNRGQFLAKLKEKNLFLQFWGDWQGQEVNGKGFMYRDGPLLANSFAVTDIEWNWHVGDKGVILEKLAFSVNGDKVLANARFWLGGPLRFASTIAVHRKPSHVSVQEPLRTVSANVQGHLNDQGVWGWGDIDFDLFFAKASGVASEKVSLAFSDAQFQVINDKLLRLHMGQAQARLRLSGNAQKIAFYDLFCTFQKPKISQFKVNLSAQLYGGNYQGQLLLDTAVHPWGVNARGTFDNIDVSRLAEVWPGFDKSRGIVSGTLALQAFSHFSLDGSLSLEGGYFPELVFLPWKIATIFQMPSLDYLTDVGLALRFKCGSQSVELKDVRLRADELSFNGFFRLDPHDFVSSRISVLFSPSLLKESPIGEKVLQLVPRAGELPFEFRLSGHRHRMNFQWEDSPLKREMERRLPGFVERSIQRHADIKASRE